MSTVQPDRISACIICYNEEAKIEDCLRSVAFADEIVVVDSMSTDRTVEISRRYTPRIVTHPWSGFVAQKNIALENARHPWVLCVDADERVSDGLRDEILTLRKNGLGGDGVTGYYIPRRTLYLGRWLAHSGWYPDRKVRLFNKSNGTWVGQDLHECVLLRGKAGYLSGDLLHLSFDGLSHHLRKIDRFTTIAAGELFSRGRRPGIASMIVRPWFTFFKMFVLRRGFLDGVPGFIAAGMSAVHVFSKYAKLWELWKNSRSSTSSTTRRSTP